MSRPVVNAMRPSCPSAQCHNPARRRPPAAADRWSATGGPARERACGRRGADVEATDGRAADGEWRAPMGSDDGGRVCGTAVVAAVPAPARRGPGRRAGASWSRSSAAWSCGITAGSSTSRRAPTTPRPGPPGSAPGPTAGRDWASPAAWASTRRRRARRGVTATSINVVFPVSNLTSLASNFGFAGDTEFGAQKAAIHTFVNEINDAGGINGRKINAIIVHFDPTNESDHAGAVQAVDRGQPAGVRRRRRARLVDRGQPAVRHPGGPHPVHRPVDDGDQLDPARARPTCGGPAPTRPQILATVVAVGQELGAARRRRSRSAIVVGDRTSDQVALQPVPAARPGRRPGVTDPVVETIAANPSDTAASNSAAPLVVQRFKAAGVQSVIPLIPFNVVLPVPGQPRPTRSTSPSCCCRTTSPRSRARSG